MKYIKRLLIISAAVVVIWYQVSPAAKVFLLRMMEARSFMTKNHIGIWEKCLFNDFEVLRFTRGGKYNFFCYATNYLPKKSTTLVFRQNGFATFVDRHFISMNDSRLYDVYNAKSVDECLHQLLKLNVDYVLTTPYDLPLISKTPVAKLLATPSRSKIIFSADGYDLYLINRRLENVDGSITLSYDSNQMKTHHGMDWSLTSGASPYVAASPLADGKYYIDGTNSEKGLYTGRGHLLMAPSRNFYECKISPLDDYIITVDIAGYGKVCVYAVYYNKNGDLIGSAELIQSIMDSDGKKGTRLFNQFRTPVGSAQMRILFVAKDAWFTLDRVTVSKARTYDTEPMWQGTMSTAPQSPNFSRPPLERVARNKFDEYMGADASEDIQWGKLLENDDHVTLYSGAGDFTDAPSSRMRYKVDAVLSGKGVFKFMTISYPFKENTQKASPQIQSHGYFLFPEDESPVRLTRHFDAPAGLADFRVGFKIIHPRKLGPFIGDMPNEGKVVINSLKIYKNVSSCTEFTGLGTPEWKQVFP